MPRGREKRAPASEEIPPKASKHHQVGVTCVRASSIEPSIGVTGAERSSELRASEQREAMICFERRGKCASRDGSLKN
jgi:hypothetical protein